MSDTKTAAAPIGAPDARPDEEMGRLKLIEKEARDLDARLMELWDLLPEGSHEDAPFSSTAVAWWGLHKALGCCTPETPTPFAFPEKQSPPAAASLEVKALDAARKVMADFEAKAAEAGRRGDLRLETREEHAVTACRLVIEAIRALNAPNGGG